MKKGLLIVVSGPSGVGKGTILKKVLENPTNNCFYSISMTTRKRREGEIDGVNYYFVNEYQFQNAIANDELLEYAEFVGNYYGTPKNVVEKMRNQGKNVVLEIEVQGATQVLEKCKDALSIFIVPPSMEELEKRIKGRASESEEVIQERLKKARKELYETTKYNYVVCNENIEVAIDTVSSIIQRKMREQELIESGN